MYKKNINNDNKKIIIEYLYSNLDLSNYRYNLLNSIERLEYLQNTEHYISPNFKGQNYLLILLKINKNNINNQNSLISCLIDRKTLSYHKSNLDINNIKMLNFDMIFPESLYNGTIFDGKIIQNNDNNNNITFLIQDCYYYKGYNMLTMNMISKFNEINNIITSIQLPSNIKLICNTLYNYEDIKNIINNLNSNKYPTNGLIFYPKLSGINFLYIEKKMINKNISNNLIIESNNINLSNNTIIPNDSIIQLNYNIINNYVDTLKTRVYSYEICTKKKNLWLCKTSIVDVYDISENEYSEKIDIATIPSMKLSIMCNELIKDNPVQFECVFYDKFNKWIPIKHIN